MLLFSRRAALAAVVSLAGLTGGYAEEVKYSAKLDGAAETRPTTARGPAPSMRNSTQPPRHSPGRSPIPASPERREPRISTDRRRSAKPLA